MSSFIHLRIDKHTKELLKEFAERTFVSESQFVREAIREKIVRLKSDSSLLFNPLPTVAKEETAPEFFNN
jgi:hypothetical protein